MFCIHCNINWASLHTEIDDAGEEQYDVCPQCKSDWCLEEKKDGPAYLYSRLTGDIIDSKTKKPRDRTVHKVSLPVIRKGTTEKEWFDRKQYLSDLEDQALEAYQQEYEKNGSESADRLYKLIMTARYDNEVKATIIEKV
jgi:hypothetical protein